VITSNLALKLGSGTRTVWAAGIVLCFTYLHPRQLPEVPEHTLIITPAFLFKIVGSMNYTSIKQGTEVGDTQNIVVSHNVS
jgi:hypothetical protein